MEATAESLCHAVLSLAARRTVDALVKDLSDRRGLKHEWAQIDPEIQREIREAWRIIILKARERT